MVDYYELLGLAKSASDADVRRAYKKAALRWHPDKNPGDRAHAETMFKRVAEAYRVLSDARQRAEYDRASVAQPATSSWWPAASTQRPPAARRDPVVTSTSRARAGADEMDEAWSLFEEFFGGRDPFKDFDAFFDDPASADFDRVFSNLGRASGSASTARAARTAGQGGGTTNAWPVRHPAPPPGQPQPFPSGAAKVRCVAQQGVAWRRSTNLADRIGNARGPERGDIIAVDCRHGDWVHAREGWLPLAIDGGRVFEALDGSETWSVRCLSAQGVAYRRTMDMNERVEGIRGPNCGDVLPLEELRGGWVRTAWGWLPLAINGAQVFELLHDAAPVRSSSPRHESEHDSDGKAEPSWGGWPSLLPALPYRLLTVMGAGSWVALRVARVVLRTWWNMWFGFLPLLWR